MFSDVLVPFTFKVNFGISATTRVKESELVLLFQRRRIVTTGHQVLRFHVSMLTYMKSERVGSHHCFQIHEKFKRKNAHDLSIDQISMYKQLEKTKQ